MPADGLTYDEAIALSDAELEERLWSRIDEVDDDEVYASLSLLIDELTERHAPHIARMMIERTSHADYLEENLEAMREREGARLIRSALEGDTD
jgi:hypothetical protein